MPRGCKPGQKHSGHFSKGFDPRRNTKGQYLQRERATVEQKFREHTETALKALLAVLEDKDAPHKDIVTAANSLLDRAHGKAVDRIQVANLGNDVGNTASLTRDELMARLTQQYTEPTQDTVSDLEDADEDADYADKDEDIEEADYEVIPAPHDYEELGEEVKYG
jgi:hypothetical protein